MPSTPTPAYVALKSCGCLVAAMVDEPQYAKTNASEISSCVKRGYRIEHVSVEEARALPWARGGGKCDHDAAQMELGEPRGSTGSAESGPSPTRKGGGVRGSTPDGGSAGETKGGKAAPVKESGEVSGG